MSARIPFPGIGHGDKVRLTGQSWVDGAFNTREVHEVDDESFHRPVIYAGSPGGGVTYWYIMDPILDYGDWSVTKVVES